MAQELLPEAAAQLHLVGQPQGPHRAATSSRAASSASTTSASSTAAPRCRPAATWSRPTAPPGWPVLPEHAGNRHGTCRSPIPTMSTWLLKFVEHFLWIASSMTHLGGDTGMWDEEDGFFYDVLRLPDGRAQRLKVRSMVGLLPLCAATVFDGELLTKYPELAERVQWFLEARPELIAAIHDPSKPGVAGRTAGLDSRRDEAPPRAGEDARRERVPQRIRHPLAVALSCRSSVRLPRRRPGVSRRLSARRIRHRHVRRQLQLARPDLDAGQRPDHPRPAAITTPITATTSRSNVRPAPAST